MVRRAGFTILEILIAIVVLVLGITGIIALFPTAIESGNKTVEDSYSAAITQSVVDALSVGVRESRYTYRATTAGRTYTYFVFNHDGVIEQPPLEPADFEKASWDGDSGDTINDKSQGAIWRRDYCVILPTAAATNADLKLEPNFMYPVPSYVPDDSNEATKDGDQYGLNQRSPARLNSTSPLTDNLSVNFLRPSATIGEQVPWISRTYHLGRYRQPLGSTNGGTELPKNDAGVTMRAGDIRLDYLGDMVSTGTTKNSTIALDPYPSYSFCFTLQRARIDTTGGPGNVPDGKLTANQDLFSDTLYTLRVRIYKNFDKEAALELKPGNNADESSAPSGGTAVPRSNIHIREFVTLIAL